MPLCITLVLSIFFSAIFRACVLYTRFLRSKKIGVRGCLGWVRRGDGAVTDAHVGRERREAPCLCGGDAVFRHGRREGAEGKTGLGLCVGGGCGMGIGRLAPCAAGGGDTFAPTTGAGTEAGTYGRRSPRL